MRHEDALRRTFAALDGIDAFAVCTLGHAFSRDRMPMSPNVLIYDWLPHEAILPHVAAVVTHAGHSTVMAALAHGVPLVCMPMGRDQDTNAERVGALGAGVTLPTSAAPAEISAAINNVLAKPSYRNAAGRLAAQIRELGRGERAVGELEGLLK
jgi:MGT family glycosyltransferase